MQDRKPDRPVQPGSPVPAVGVVCWRGDEVLLIRRGRPPRQSDWSIPGGKIGWGETLRDAARRELREETGVEADIGDLAGVYEIIESGFHFVLLDYSAVWTSGEARAADDAAEAGFFSLEEALNLLPHNDLRDVVLRSRDHGKDVRVPD